MAKITCWDDALNAAAARNERDPGMVADAWEAEHLEWCPRCNGRGKVLTAAAQAALDDAGDEQET